MGLLDRLFYKTRKYYDDDFDWNTYTSSSYARQLGQIGRDHTMIANDGALSFDAATGRVTCADPPLHENSLLILEAIGQLEPESVHEAGCGGGDHLGNASRLYPEIRFSGSDRGETQLALLRDRHPHLAGSVMLQDLTMPYSDHWPEADLVYTQAVIMHIHTAVSHFVALANLMRMAQKYVLLMENLQCHDFVAEVQALHDGGHSGWPDLHIHRFDGSHGARAILLSKTRLDYPVVTSDDDMRAGLKPSARRLKRAADDRARAIYGPSR